eukprot:NODE_887_length_1786_cov_28.140446_g831_i0.p1 GENE.NODE_887_length_1786_cov_28.140446_g831_i0~~NODE_887_length_1786_cov_28.140446_g831_i0.p1  ORF type:complete len:579 (-),score=169.37 NODE_887_length_1786_cov_28.140446_g831_i0:49-1722(-)
MDLGTAEAEAVRLTHQLAEKEASFLQEVIDLREEISILEDSAQQAAAARNTELLDLLQLKEGELKAAVGKHDTLERLVSNLQNNCTEQSTLILTLQQEKLAMDEAFTDTNSRSLESTQPAALEAQLQASQTLNHNLQAHLNDLATQLEQTSKDFGRHQSVNDASRDENSKLELEALAQKDQVLQLQTQVEGVGAQCQQLLCEVQEKDDLLANVREAQLNLQAECDQLQQKCECLAMHEVKLQAAVVQAEAELQDAHTEQSEAAEQLSKCYQHIDDLTEKCKNVDIEREQLLADIEQLENQVAKQSKDIEAQQVQIQVFEQMQTQLAAIEKRNTELCALLEQQNCQYLEVSRIVKTEIECRLVIIYEESFAISSFSSLVPPLLQLSHMSSDPTSRSTRTPAPVQWRRLAIHFNQLSEAWHMAYEECSQARAADMWQMKRLTISATESKAALRHALHYLHLKKEELHKVEHEKEALHQRLCSVEVQPPRDLTTHLMSSNKLVPHLRKLSAAESENHLPPASPIPYEYRQLAPRNIQHDLVVPLQNWWLETKKVWADWLE